MREEHARKIEENLQLAIAFFRRADPGGDGRAALARKFPGAPKEMISSAAHHVYADGCEAAIDFVAAAERFLRDPEATMPPDYGVTFHLLDHIYNWHMFQQLIPDAKPTLVELLKELNEAVACNDRDGVLRTTAQFEEILLGHQNPPSIAG